MKLAHALRNPRSRIAITIAVVAAVALLFALEPAAAWDTTNMPSAGGSSTYWYEGSNSDPLVILR